MDIYCKLSKCIGRTSCSYEHYLVKNIFVLPVTKIILNLN